MIAPRIDDEVAKLRVEIAREGGCTADPSRLQRLCPGERSAGKQFLQIAAIARREGWSFAFLRDGSVRFGSYAPVNKRRT